MDKVFWICDLGNLDNHKEFFLLKKLMAGNCIWSTCQVLMGWVIETSVLTSTSGEPLEEDPGGET